MKVLTYLRKKRFSLKDKLKLVFLKQRQGMSHSRYVLESCHQGWSELCWPTSVGAGAVVETVRAGTK